MFPHAVLQCSGAYVSVSVSRLGVFFLKRASRGSIEIVVHGTELEKGAGGGGGGRKDYSTA